MAKTYPVGAMKEVNDLNSVGIRLNGIIHRTIGGRRSDLKSHATMIPEVDMIASMDERGLMVADNDVQRGGTEKTRRPRVGKFSAVERAFALAASIVTILVAVVVIPQWNPFHHDHNAGAAAQPIAPSVDASTTVTQHVPRTTPPRSSSSPSPGQASQTTSVPLPTNPNPVVPPTCDASNAQQLLSVKRPVGQAFSVTFAVATRDFLGLDGRVLRQSDSASEAICQVSYELSDNEVQSLYESVLYPIDTNGDCEFDKPAKAESLTRGLPTKLCGLSGQDRTKFIATFTVSVEKVWTISGVDTA